MAQFQTGEVTNFSRTNSICGQVSHRDSGLKTFSQKHDVIVFVSGKKSSNGKVLYGVCKAENERSFKVSVPEEVDISWLEGAKTVGICGATSTPRWLMEDTKKWIEERVN